MRGATLAGTLALLALTTLAFGATSAPATISNPPGNRQLSGATVAACNSNPSGSSCTTLALGDINAARASEGVRPMALPSNFSSLTVLEQTLVVADLERTGRGLTPILGHSAPLDADAERGAVAGQDPSPTAFNGNAWGSNWEGGYASALEADFVWMYDDGPGSDNVDCKAPGGAGCWGHRENIVSGYDAPLVMGVGYAPAGLFGAAITELFVGGDQDTGPGQPDAPIVPAGYSPAAGGSPGSPHPTPQAALRIGKFRYAHGRLAFTATLIRGRGTVHATASRARHTVKLHVARRGSRFTISGPVGRGTWTVRVVLVGAGGWRGRTYVIRVRI